MITAAAPQAPRPNSTSTNLSLKVLFKHLNSLITQFNSLKKSSFNKEVIDFGQALNSAAQELSIEIDSSEDHNITTNFKEIKDLNLISFAIYLDNLIRTTANQNPDSQELQNLAAKNIFTAFINKKVLPKVANSFFGHQINYNDLATIISSRDLEDISTIQSLSKEMTDPSRKHFYIFDIDGTLRDNEVNCKSFLTPNLDIRVIDDLIRLNNKSHNRLLLLTARHQKQIKRSNIRDTGINVVTDQGISLAEQDEKFRTETKNLADNLTLLLNRLIGEHKFEISPYTGWISIEFSNNNYAHEKTEVLEVLKALMKANTNDWSVSGDYSSNGQFIILHKNTFNYGKGEASEKIITDSLNSTDPKNKIDENTNIYVIGDTSGDYRAMEKIKEMKLPDGVKTFSIAVGDQLNDRNKYSAVDHRLSNHRAVAKLLNQIAA